jgi:hypothetical protein
MKARYSLVAAIFPLCQAVAALALAAQAAPEPPAGPLTAGSGPTHMFQIALVVAEPEASAAAPQNLPKSVQKALSDLGDFLPYKSYRMVDSALLRTNGYAKAELEGPAAQRYSLTMSYREESAGSFMIDHFALTRLAKPAADGRPQAPLGAGVAPLPPDQPLSSAFRIARGETVVVGSSGLKAGRAMIVVLTAVP